MYDPDKRLGEEDKSPAMVVAVKMGKPGKFDPSKRIGEGESEDAEPETAEPNQLKDEAAAGLCKAFNVSTSAAPRVREYLEAFYRACDSEPKGETESETQIEDSKE
jgi:hypothetical protein